MTERGLYKGDADDNEEECAVEPKEVQEELEVLNKQED